MAGNVSIPNVNYALLSSANFVLDFTLSKLVRHFIDCLLRQGQGGMRQQLDPSAHTIKSHGSFCFLLGGHFYTCSTFNYFSCIFKKYVHPFVMLLGNLFKKMIENIWEAPTLFASRTSSLWSNGLFFFLFDASNFFFFFLF